MVLETARPEIDLLLDRYDEKDPAAAKKLFEIRASMDPKNFLLQVRRALVERPASNSVKFAAGLLNFEDIVQIVLETYRKSREDAIALAAKLQASDPRFDTLFLKRYADKDAVKWSEGELLIALDILDAVSERDRLVLGVSKFLRHPNPGLRSKAAKFLARRRPTLGVIADLARETDSIVRAGLIEGLYDRKEEFVPPLFRKHIADDDPTVAGSALFGLYLSGDPGAIPLIDEMAKDSRPAFREVTGSVMASTGDPRFSSTLAGQMSDPSDLVRRQALRGLGEMKKTMAVARTQSPLQLVILKHDSATARQCLQLTVSTTCGENVRGISGTKFLLKAGGSFVREYTVEEYHRGTPLNAALLLCEPPKGEQIIRDEFDESADRCLTLRRSRDTLELSKLSHETHLRCYANDASSSIAILTKALNELDFGTPGLNVVAIGATSQTRGLERLIELASRAAATIHVIAVTPEWQTGEMKRLVVAGGGYFRTAEPSNLSQVCFETYSALLHHYRICWEKGSGDLELEVRSDSGIGTAVHQLQSEIA